MHITSFTITSTMISKDFTACGRPSISGTCIFIHFNLRFLKTWGNRTEPLEINFFSKFALSFLFFRYSHASVKALLNESIPKFTNAKS